MRELKKAHFQRLALDAFLWLCAPAAFLFFYVSRYLAPATAVLPHVRLVVVLLLCLQIIRFLLARLIRSAGALRCAAALVTSAFLAAMFCYYALVIAGFESWRRVISWELITGYARQAPELARALEISLLLVSAVLALCYLCLFAITWLYIRRFDWSQALGRGVSASVQVIAVVCAGAIVGIELYRFVMVGDFHEAEPVSLTFFAANAVHEVQNSTFDRLAAAHIDRTEDAARASYAPNRGASHKNVILIVVDALRPDHMGVYGYGRDTTPYLSELARAGLVQKAPPMHASCGESACSLISLSSSKYVHQFSDHPFTLQHVLKRHGYRIHMILGGDHTHFYGLRERYGKVDSYFDGSMAKGSYVNDDQLVVEKVAALPEWDAVPVMFQLHLMSAHILGKRSAAASRYLPAANYALNKLGGLDPADRVRGAVNFYDNGVLQADAAIRNILLLLQQKGYLKNAIVAITGDHGESLGEHGLFAHANSVREELLRIPFLMISYGGKTRPFSDQRAFSSQVDIAPTFLDELNMPLPATWSGLPLQQAAVLDYTYFEQGSDSGLIDHRDPGRVWKYWRSAANAKEYAFELNADPKEGVNVLAAADLPASRDWRLQMLTPARGSRHR